MTTNALLTFEMHGWLSRNANGVGAVLLLSVPIEEWHDPDVRACASKTASGALVSAGNLKKEGAGLRAAPTD